MSSLTQQMIDLPATRGRPSDPRLFFRRKYLVGPGIFRHTAPVSSTTKSSASRIGNDPPDALEFPSDIFGVTQVGSQYFAAAEYVNSDFERKVGVCER